MVEQKNSFFVIVTLFLISIFPLVDVFFPAKIEDTNRILPVLNKTITLIFLGGYFFLKKEKRWFKNSISKILTVLIITQISYFLVSSNNLINDLYGISKMLVWYFGYFFFFDISHKRLIKIKTINRFFFISTICLFLLVYFGTTNELLFKANRDYGSSNFAYYLLFTLPYLFMNKKVPYRLIVFVVVFLGVLISFKRGTIILFTILTTYIVFFSNIKNIVKQQFARSFKLLVIVVIGVVLFITNPFSNEKYINKFSDFKELNLDTGDFNKVGSGRGLLYTLPLKRWITANPFNFFWGYGFNSTSEYYKTTPFFDKEIMSHSDFVMLIHDCGLLGLIIFSSFFVRLFGVFRSATQYLDKIPLAIIFITFFWKALISGLILSSYSVYGFAILGLILGRKSRSHLDYKHQKLQQHRNKTNNN